jgi:hypothetical protein
MKAVFELDTASLAAGGDGVLDRTFIDENTSGFDLDAFVAMENCHSLETPNRYSA